VPAPRSGKIVDKRSLPRPADRQPDTDPCRRQVTAMNGSGRACAGFKAEYDAVQDPRKDLFGFIDLASTQRESCRQHSKVGNWVQAGTVSLGAGQNVWAGGDNSVPYAIQHFPPGRP